VNREGLVVFVILAILAAIIAPHGLRRLAEQPDPIGYALIIVAAVLFLVGLVVHVQEEYAIDGWAGVATMLIVWILLGVAIIGIGWAFGWVKGLFIS
jgi:uncharacterized membrane protein